MKKRLWKIIGVLFLFFLVVGIFSDDTDSSSEESAEKGQETSVETSLEAESMEEMEKAAESQNNKTEAAEKETEGQSSKTEESENSAKEPTNAAEGKKQEEAAREYIFPDSDRRYLTEKEVRGIDAGELRIARNELFARHGYIFQDEEMRQYFESQQWYSGTIEAGQFDFDTDLNDYEKKNAELINLVEEEGGGTETVSEENGGETEAAAEEDGGQGQAADGADAPYLSTEYLGYYLTKYHMEVNDFSEREKIIDFIQSYHKEPIYLKEDGGFLKKPYYAMTTNYTEFLYQGQMKDNKPDGMGAIYKSVYLSLDAESIGESDTAQIYESSSMADQYNLACVYAGYFKEGRPEGYGMEFSVPGDEDYFIREIPISGCQSEEDVQGAFLEMANPIRYEGEFEEGEYSGRGNEYAYMETYVYDSAGRDTFLDEEDYIEAAGGDEEAGAKAYDIVTGANKDINIYTGTYEKGERNGEFKIYELGCLSYEGGIKKGKYHGVGTEYYPMSQQVYYEGEWKNGEPHGTGTRYFEDGRVYYSGKWEYGDCAN